MSNKSKVTKSGVLLMLALGMSWLVSAQEIDWYSIDNGGGVSAAGDVTLLGVVGQTDAVLMEGSSVTVSGGYLPLSADLIFEDRFD